MGSRTLNTQRNIISGLIRQIVNIVLAFMIRTIILYVLGELYQGISSLFKSILTVLNIADLGFSSVVIYSLYKPVAEKDYDTVGAVLAFLRRIYFLVGLFILVGGLVAMPFLPKLIKGEYPQNINIFVVYAIYLIDSASSYLFFGYKNALLVAMQRDDLANNCRTITSLVVKVVQILILVITKNYYLFVIMMPLCSITSNLLMQIVSKKYFPYIKVKGKINPSLKKDMSIQIKGIVISRFSDTARNSLDNIVISSLIGLSAVAVYNNYHYIFSSLYYLIALVVTNAMRASIGNSIATESVEKNYRDLRKFSFLFAYITGWCAICMCCLYQPFVFIWMRGNINLMLPEYSMILICIYFYVTCMRCIQDIYLSGNGIFWQLRYANITEAGLNIILNFVLGYYLGITGVVLSSIITIFFCNFMWGSSKLFSIYFKFSPKEYYHDHLLFFIRILIIGVICYFICNFVLISGLLGLIIRLLVCIIIPLGLFIVLERKNPYFEESKTIVLGLLKKVIGR